MGLVFFRAFGRTNHIWHWSRSVVLRHWIINSNLALRSECCLESGGLAFTVADLSSGNDVFTLTNAEVLLDCSSTTVAFFRAIRFVSANPVDITFLSRRASIVD